MGWKHISTLDELAPHPSKESVGNMDECDTVKIQEGKNREEDICRNSEWYTAFHLSAMMMNERTR